MPNSKRLQHPMWQQHIHSAPWVSCPLPYSATSGLNRACSLTICAGHTAWLYRSLYTNLAVLTVWHANLSAQLDSLQAVAVLCMSVIETEFVNIRACNQR